MISKRGVQNKDKEGKKGSKRQKQKEEDTATDTDVLVFRMASKGKDKRTGERGSLGEKYIPSIIYLVNINLVYDYHQPI